MTLKQSYFGRLVADDRSAGPGKRSPNHTSDQSDNNNESRDVGADHRPTLSKVLDPLRAWNSKEMRACFKVLAKGEYRGLIHNVSTNSNTLQTGSGTKTCAPKSTVDRRWCCTPKNFGQPSRLPAVNHLWTIVASMGTRPDTPVRALRRRHDALLTIWLAFLDELDNPVHPCAAECRQEQRLLRDTSTRGLSQVRAVNCSLLVHSAKRP